MSTRKIPFASGEFYHLYNRGNSKQKTFLDKKDYQRFIDLLFAMNSEEKFNFSDSLKGISIYERFPKNPLVSIGAYCLMPNHFHILVTPMVNGGVSKFMQKLSTGYVMYFNQKYSRTGALFEGKFKSEHASTDKYLKYLFSYIHLNPVKLFQKDWKEVGIKNKAKSYEYLLSYSYSSFLDYLGRIRIQNRILNPTAFPKYFPAKKDFVKEISQWISYSETLEARPKEFYP